MFDSAAATNEWTQNDKVYIHHHEGESTNYPYLSQLSTGGIDINTKEIKVEIHQEQEKTRAEWIDASETYQTYIAPIKCASKIMFLPTAKAIITDRVKIVLDKLLYFLERESRRNYIPVNKVEVSCFSDPEDGKKTVIVAQFVRVSPKISMNYWDILCARLDVWANSLPEDYKEIFMDRISTEVRPEIND